MICLKGYYINKCKTYSEVENLIKKVYENIYLIEVALPNNPLKALNSYVIKGADKSLIIDTGFNQKECIDILVNGLKELDVDSRDTELFITHLHSDHSGMANLFAGEGVKIYSGEVDGKIINEMTEDLYWRQFDDLKVLFDLERDNITFTEHPGYKYALNSPVEFTYVKEGDKIEIDEYVFEVISIPGHTPGHIGLYEEKHKLFFGGDHILDSITPNIGFWGLKDDILATYFNSLNKIHTFDIDYLFASHRNILTEHKKRIDELFLHHKKRLNEILEVLEEGELTVRDVASRMSWRIRAKDWDHFPGPQKWFASEEAMSHLQHLYFSKKIDRELRDNKFYFKLK